MLRFNLKSGKLIRIWLSVGLLSFALGLLQGQNHSRLHDYEETDLADQLVDAKYQISEFLFKVNSKSKKSDRLFLKTVFGQTHKQFLKEYQQYAGFNEIFSNGNYDCVTATALYSLLLEELGFTHEVYETKYHVFLLIESSEGQFLIESTDPINGFEYQQDRIKERIALYQEDQDLKYGQLNTAEEIAPIKKVTPSELTGLLYFNQCVKFFNSQQFLSASAYLSKAKLYYNSARTSEMEAILSNYIVSNTQQLNADITNKLLISQRQEP